MGMGSSFCLIGLLIAIRQCIPHQFQATFIGISQLIATLGPFVAAGPMVFISHTFELSWRDIFMGFQALDFVYLF